MATQPEHSIAVISDLHGNLHALRAVIDDLKNNAPGIQELLVLGDVLSIGPNPGECIDLLCARSDVACVMGNNDRYVLTQIYEAKGVSFHTDIYQKIPEGLLANLRWCHDALSPAQLKTVESWPRSITRTINGRTFCISHGSPDNDEENVMNLLGDAPFLAKYASFDAYLFGHTHLSCNQRIGKTLFVNPGSVGGPFDGDIRASYAVITVTDADVTAEIRRVEYDIEAAFAAIRRKGVPWTEEIITVMRRASLH